MQEFHAILEEEELKDSVVLVFANKQVIIHDFISNSIGIGHRR